MNPLGTVRRLYTRVWDLAHRPENVLNREWDNLLILDACRYDAFRSVASSYLPASGMERRSTIGSSTPEFLDRTFGDGQHWDTVYVTGNPQPVRFASESEQDPWHAIISALPAWDYDTQTVPPEAVAGRARAAADLYPDKRLIVHFLQPHAPFLGGAADFIRQEYGLTIGGVDPGRDYTDWEPQDIDSTSYEDAIEAGVPVELIRQAYAETLHQVLDVAVGLARDLRGRTVLTADHGERLGERAWGVGAPQWEHPSGGAAVALRRVPWVVLDNGPRRETRASPPAEHTADQSDTKRHLRALGYA